MSDTQLRLMRLGLNAWLAQLPRVGESGHTHGFRGKADCSTATAAGPVISVYGPGYTGDMADLFDAGRSYTDVSVSWDDCMDWSKVMRACDEQHGPAVTAKLFGR